MLSCRVLVAFLVFLAVPCAARPATPVQILRVHNVEVTSLAWSNDGKTIASGDKAGVLTLSNAQTGKIRLRLKYSQQVTALAFSPDSKILVVGRGREVRLLGSQTGAPVRVLKLQNSAGKALSFSRDGHKLMAVEGVAGQDNFAVSIWQLPQGKLLRRWTRTTDGDMGTALSTDGRTVAISAGPVELMSIATGKRLREWHDNTEKEEPYFLSLAFAPDSRSLAGGGGYFEGPGHVALWNATGKLGWFDTFQDYATVLAFSPHNRLLAVGTEHDTTYVEKPRADGGDVFLYNLQTHKRDFTLQGHKGAVNALAWSPDGKRIASGSKDHTLRIWTLAGK